jgi:hypothetical protein
MIDREEPCDCGGTFRFTVNDVAKERSVRCSRGCGASIRLQDGGGAAEAAAAERALDEALKGIGGTTNIKI